MADDKLSSANRDQIGHEAASWIARSDRGLTPPEQDEFFQWLAEDPRHGEWLARHQETVRSLKALAQWRPEHGSRPNPDLLEAPVRLRRWRLLPACAAAAGLVLLLGSWWLRPVNVGFAPAASVALPDVVTEQRILPDGSVIDLNRGAVVEVRFTPAERRVRLARGEGFFAVAKNAARPFVVQVGTVEIRAIGTAFNVNVLPATVDILVTEGKVTLDQPVVREASGLSVTGAAATPTLVEAGNRAMVSLERSAPPPEVVRVSPKEIGRLLAWQPRQLDFTDTPLGLVVAEFNRENPVKMLVEGAELGALPIGGTFRSDNLQGFVRLLEASFQVQVERKGDTIVLRREKVTARR